MAVLINDWEDMDAYYSCMFGGVQAYMTLGKSFQF